MIITVKGAIKPYYLETLAMTFFPGEKFSPEDCDKRAAAEIAEDDEGVTATVSLTLPDGREETATASEGWREDGRDRTRKTAAGRAFFEAASRLTGYRPPWGAMTGVRPSKLASEFLARGMSEEEAARELDRTFLTLPEKSSLAASVAKAENELVTGDQRKKCSVYVAIPFCPTRCAYCSFVSYASPGLLKLIPGYLDALTRDIEFTGSLIRELGLEVSSVYVGGGTPTILDPGQLDRLLSKLSPLADGAGEFTLESGRPDTITEEKLRVATFHGVDRISVNPQTLNGDVLRLIGREHTVDDFYRAFDTARRAGVKNVNVDLIAGLPGDSAESFRRSFDGIAGLRPENVTVHTFAVKKSAQFKADGADVYDREGISASESVSYARRAAEDAGYRPYYMYRQKNTAGNLENVGYSLPGHEGMYNVYIMEEIHSIFACGASSVTKFVADLDGVKKDIVRIFEAKYPYEYLRSRENGEADAAREKLRRDAVAFYGKHKLL